MVRIVKALMHTLATAEMIRHNRSTLSIVTLISLN